MQEEGTLTGQGNRRSRTALVASMLVIFALPLALGGLTVLQNRSSTPIQLQAAAETMWTGPATTYEVILDDDSSTSAPAVEPTASEVDETTSTEHEPSTAPVTAWSSTTVAATVAPTSVAPAPRALAATATTPTPPPTQPKPTTTAAPPPTSPPPGGSEAAVLACIRQRESGGNYGAVSPGGIYRGAYQFSQSTWDGTARAAGRADLVGKLANVVAPGDQDQLALTLYRASGLAPWGGHCP